MRPTVSLPTPTIFHGKPDPLDTVDAELEPVRVILHREMCAYGRAGRRGMGIRWHVLYPALNVTVTGWTLSVEAAHANVTDVLTRPATVLPAAAFGMETR